MQGLATKTQQRILAACNRGNTPSVFGEDMTAKEKNGELEECFGLKYALAKKISHNRAEIFRAETAARSEMDKNKYRTLIQIIRSGEAIVENQMGELALMSVKILSKQLGFSESLINHRYKMYVRDAA